MCDLELKLLNFRYVDLINTANVRALTEPVNVRKNFSTPILSSAITGCFAIMFKNLLKDFLLDSRNSLELAETESYYT